MAGLGHGAAGFVELRRLTLPPGPQEPCVPEPGSDEHGFSGVQEFGCGVFNAC